MIRSKLFVNRKRKSMLQANISVTGSGYARYCKKTSNDFYGNMQL